MVVALTLRPSASSERFPGAAAQRSHSEAGKKALVRQGSSASRAHSVAALVLNSTPTFKTVLRVSVTTTFDVPVVVTVQGGQAEGSGLPDVCAPGTTSTGSYIANVLSIGRETRGTLELGGFE